MSAHIGSIEPGKRADLVLWDPMFFAVKPDLVMLGGSIACAPMGDPNASIPTPQPVHYRPMFAAFGKALTSSSVTFVSAAAIDAGLAGSLGVGKAMLPVANTRGGVGKASMIHNAATPHIEVDPETYEVRADGRTAHLRARRGAGPCAKVFPVLSPSLTSQQRVVDVLDPGGWSGPARRPHHAGLRRAASPAHRADHRPWRALPAAPSAEPRAARRRCPGAGGTAG
ncbi:MAG: hypothetical protein WDN45_15820 [Caulobacteraceae bacterium]